MNQERRERRKAGKGHPPPEFQFAPGTSGNPRGRPPGALGLKGQLRRQLQQTVRSTDGTAVAASVAIARTVIDLARKGDLRAVQLLLSCCPDDIERGGEPAASPSNLYDGEALVDEAELSRNMKNETSGDRK
jgi:hypothetical protein